MHKLGFYLHLSTDQHGLWDAIRRVRPPVILFHADTANTMLLEEIRRFRAPDALVIGRMYVDNHDQRRMLEDDRPEIQGAALAERILQYDFGLATRRLDGNGPLLIDAWMGLNEALPGPASDQYQDDPAALHRLYANFDRFEAAFHQRLQDAGVASIAFNFAAGNFSRPEHYLDHFSRTLGAATYLGFHEYGWPTLYPAPESATGAGLYRTCMEGIRAEYGHRHRAVITEAGLTRMYQRTDWGDVGWLNDEDPLDEAAYWASLDWYNEQLCRDDYVVGACLYQVGHSGHWESFRHLGADNRGETITLLDRIAALAPPAAPQMPAPAPAFAPPARADLAGLIFDVAGEPAAGAVVRLVGPQETLGSVRAAASADAGLVTWTRRITGFAGHRWNCWTKYVAQEVAGISWPEFADKVLLYNPHLDADGAIFHADKEYLLPENRLVEAEIVWDRPVAGFAGNVWQCWQQLVENKVVGLTYDDFKRDVVHFNPDLAEDGLRFHADRRYQLPRNVGQKEYVLYSVTDRTGRFRMADLPVGPYRLEITAAGQGTLVHPLTLDESGADLLLTLPRKPAVTEVNGDEPGPGFVRALGSNFFVDGKLFRFVGANIRGMVHYGDGVTLPHAPDHHKREQLQAARQMGARVVRVFLASRHAQPHQVEARLRGLLDLMRTDFPELYLIPAFTNLYADVPFFVHGDDGYYANNLLNRAFFTGGYQDHYLPLVERIVPAFRDETRIFAWEIGNELKLDRADPNDGNDPNPRLFIDFMHTVARRIRQLDRNHMVTTGNISTRHAWLFDMLSKRRLYDTPDLHFVTVHAYNGDNREDDSGVARALDMPFIVEEAGFDAGPGQDRSGQVQADMDKWFSLGARGYLQWGLMATPDNGDGDRNSGMDRVFHTDWDALVGIYRARADALAQPAPSMAGRF